MTYARDSRVSDLATAIGVKEVAQDAATALADGKAVSAQRAAGKTPQDFGAIGDGVTDDRAAFVAALADTAPLRAFGTFKLSALGVPAKPVSGRATLLRSAVGNLMTGNATGARIEGWTLDMARASLGNAAGHGFSLQGDDISIRDVTVRDFGSDGVGGGTGVLIYGTDETTKAKRARLDDLSIFADPAATQSFGWILANVDHGFVSRVYAQDVRGTATSYAHELKNNAQFNSLGQLIAKASQVALAYGQDTAGVDGADYNVATNIVSDGCDVGIVVGEGFGNVFSGIVYNATGAAGAQKYAAHLTGGSGENVINGLASFGAATTGLRIEGPRNAVQIAAHDTATNIVDFRAGSERNFIEVLHPGARLTIEGAYLDTVGTGLKGSTANVIHSPATGEWFGSLSGSFKWKLGASGAAFLTTQRFRFEDDTTIAFAMATPTGQQIGLAHNTPARQATGSLVHVSNATDTSEYWEMRTGGTNILRWYSALMRAVTDAAYDLGSAAFRFKDAFVQRIRPGAGTAIWTSGAGTPEGTVTAPVGSLYTRTDGGAATVLYIKESGTGSTGWVAK